MHNGEDLNILILGFLREKTDTWYIYIHTYTLDPLNVWKSSSLRSIQKAIPFKFCSSKTGDYEVG